MFFGRPSACLYVWIWASIRPDRLDGFYSYSVFKSLSIIGLRWWLRILKLKNQRPFTGTPPKTVLLILIIIQFFTEIISLNKYAQISSSRR
jgi:hypothetical protein